MSIRLTDHAKVRYLERVLKIDLDDLFRREVLTDSIEQKVLQKGDGLYLTEARDCLLLVRQNQVVTVLLPRMRTKAVVQK